LYGLGLLGFPDEPASEGSPNLELVSNRELVNEVRGHLATWESVDRKFDPVAGACGGNGIGPHGLVPVWSSEAGIKVLAGNIAAPSGDVEHDAAPGRCLRTSLGHDADFPAARYQ
jgi:hypothetical protein